MFFQFEFEFQFETQNRKQNNLKNALSKFSPTTYTYVEELSNCYDYFLRLSGFPHLFGKVFFITFKFSLFESSTAFLQGQCN